MVVNKANNFKKVNLRKKRNGILKKAARVIHNKKI